MNYRKWGKSAVLTFLSLSHPRLPLSAEMSWGSLGIVEVVVVRVGRAGCSLIDTELFGLVRGGVRGWQDKQNKQSWGVKWSLVQVKDEWEPGKIGGRRKEKKRRTQSRSQNQKGGKRVKDGRDGGREDGLEEEEEEKRNTPLRRCAHYSLPDESPATSPHRS